jgi:hypothetical protein
LFPVLEVRVAPQSHLTLSVEVIMLAKRCITLVFTLAVLMMFTPHGVVADTHDKVKKPVDVCFKVPILKIVIPCKF